MKEIKMIRTLIAAALLTCMASASAAASFRYTSETITQTDYFLQHAELGFLFYDDDINAVSGVSIVFDINALIRRNTTYVYDRASRNWDISLVGGASRGIQDRWIEDDDDLIVSITTGANRQVIDWNFLINLDSGSDSDSFNLRRDRSAGSYEFIDEGCVDAGNEEFDCVISRGFPASDVGKWDPVTPVPLPASLPLLGAGLLAFGALRRMKRG